MLQDPYNFLYFKFRKKDIIRCPKNLNKNIILKKKKEFKILTMNHIDNIINLNLILRKTFSIYKLTLNWIRG